MQKKIYMIHPFIKNTENIYGYMHFSQNEVKELVWDSSSPDYLIATEHIYYDKNAWELFVKLYKTSKINIFFAGECVEPDMNIFDYSICFDRDHEYGDRIIRIPTRVFYSNHIKQKKNPLQYKSISDIREELQRKEGFCNFIYSNPNGDIHRKLLFEEINKYKRVDSLGEYLNNKKIDKAIGTNLTETVINSIELKRKYKFSIACENACYRGYTSEKIWTSLQANTIPIYWGDPTVDLEVNSEAFIDSSKYSSFKDLTEIVREIDEDDQKWMHMISQPWMTNEQEENEKKEFEKYLSSIKSIFEWPPDLALRRGFGFHPDNYRKWFLYECQYTNTIGGIKQ